MYKQSPETQNPDDFNARILRGKQKYMRDHTSEERKPKRAVQYKKKNNSLLHALFVVSYSSDSFNVQFL